MTDAGLLITMLMRGGVVGFAIAAPVGPIGLLCITRTLERGVSSGVSTGLGAAGADAVYGLIVVLGFGAIAAHFIEHAAAFKLVGGLLLIWLGASHVVKKSRAPAPQPAAAGVPARVGAGPAASFASAFALTLTNPMTILAFAGAVAALTDEAAGVSGAVAGSAVVIGVFLGSMAWWLTLVGIVTAVGSVLSQTFINGIQLLSSAILVGMGLYAILLGMGVF